MSDYPVFGQFPTLPEETMQAILDLLENPALPAVTTTDNGKILMVVSGKWKEANAPTELPAVTGSDNGKLLGVSGGKWDKVSAPTELPAVTAEDDGKVLKVVNGAWAAVLEE